MGFDCRECPFGWLRHCYLRSDESLRDERAAKWQRNQGSLNTTGNLQMEIEAAVLMILRRQDMALPSVVLWRLMPPHLRAQLAAGELDRLLCFSAAFRESSPRMFRAASASRPPPVREVPPLAMTSGRALEELTYSNEPFPPATQAQKFKTLAGVRLGLKFTDHPSGIAELSSRVDDLMTRVLVEQGWSVSELATYAFTGTKLPPPPGDPEGATARRVLLESVVALDLLRRRPRDVLQYQGDAIREELVRRNLRLVAQQAHHYARGGFLRYADLFQEGCIGLLRAIEKFDAFMGFEFSTYATWWIRQAITRAVADQELAIRLPVHVVERVNAVSFAERRLRSEFHRWPTDAEIQALLPDLGAPVASVRAAKAILVSLQPYMRTELQLAEEEGTFDSVDTAMVVWSALDQLSPQESRVIQMRYGLGRHRKSTLQQVGDALGFTRERARQIEAKAFQNLRGALTDARWMPDPGAHATPPTEGGQRRESRARLRRRRFELDLSSLGVTTESTNATDAVAGLTRDGNAGGIGSTPSPVRQEPS